MALLNQKMGHKHRQIKFWGASLPEIIIKKKKKKEKEKTHTTINTQQFYYRILYLQWKIMRNLQSLWNITYLTFIVIC